MDERYSRKREAERARQARISRDAREIGDKWGRLPGPANAARRAAATKRFWAFCRWYLPDKCTAQFGKDHREVCDQLQSVAETGGQLAIAMPRGSGKSVLCDALAAWALLTGKRRFVVVIAATAKKATERLQALKHVIEQNPHIAADWPEICYPVHRCEQSYTRRLLYRGQRVHVSVQADRIVLPDIPGAPGGGGVMLAAGLTGDLRGANVTASDGSALRPDLAIVDDPQTDESALSPSQCEYRERVIKRSVLGLAGAGSRIGCVVPCTCIAEGDLAERLLNRDLNPEFRGITVPALYQLPDRMDLWNEYYERRRAELREGGDGSAATQWYTEHRADMDQGAVHYWPEQQCDGFASPLEFAMEWMLRDPAGFAAECQQKPQSEHAETVRLTEIEIEQRVSGLKHREIPAEATKLTAFIDVQEKLLYYLVAAWEADFTGYVIDYGAWPEQSRPYYTLRDARNTLRRKYPGHGVEAAWRAGLLELIDELCGRAWKRIDEAELHMGRLAIDANYGMSTSTVRAVARATPHRSIVIPAHGRYVGARHKPFSQYARRKGETAGADPWRTSVIKGQQHFLYDTNWWKSFVHERLAREVGDRSGLSLWGKGQRGGRVSHRMIAEQLTAERRQQVQAGGRTVDEWVLIPGRDNHLLDCMVGAAALASSIGVSLEPGRSGTGKRRKRKQVRYA